ncbi:major intracellular serine protease [Bacillus pakistanensis]|uniref:Major intracellular serine protease n=1 Tax=Rossellomorea pakistanensis TaxID=992288 RepID=A0ABS2NIV8_9BACI|nr:S8 family peptidase [Bacillus pakistanensis]MBM7587799.1 major intracellular serine protease [Bacillus pakistanensis]
MDHSIRVIPHKKEFVMEVPTEIPQGVELVQAPSIWKTGVKGKDVVIAVLDTGCDQEHPDLKGRIIGGRNFTTDDDGDPENVTDYNGHGTHVSGTMAANENSLGVIGVAPEASLLIVKVLSGERGSGQYDWIVSGIQYAIDQKVDIISMSLGGPNDYKPLHDVIKKAVDANILVVCAAGNEGDEDHSTEEFSYPAGYNEVISVGAIDFERRSSYFTNSNNEVDLVAPGEDIISTVPGEKYAKYSGTSMSAPHVSGALALIKNLEESNFERILTEPELYAQLIRRTIPLSYQKTLEGNGMLYLTTPDLLKKHLEESQFSISV